MDVIKGIKDLKTKPLGWKSPLLEATRAFERMLEAEGVNLPKMPMLRLEATLKEMKKRGINGADSTSIIKALPKKSPFVELIKA